MTYTKLEMIDWSERYPNEIGPKLCLRESTYCYCGKPKQIGIADCGCGVTDTISQKPLTDGQMPEFETVNQMGRK